MKKVNLFLIITVVAVLVAFLNLSVFIYKIGKITGHAADTGVANLTVEAEVNVNFTTDSIEWGSGKVTAGQTSATLNTADNSATNITNGNWTGNTAGLVLRNIGNVNVSLTLQAGKAAAAFVGGTSPDYEWNISDTNLSGSCKESNVALGEFFDVNSTGPSAIICNPLGFDNAIDSIRIDIKLVIPYDSTTGVLTDTITATATAV
ncbi:MAG: hypothetical protein KJ559_00055 [Nanoarchaeota archaeon]|nr:hypothetical protein [Nanoarchaeota archaeon]